MNVIMAILYMYDTARTNLFLKDFRKKGNLKEMAYFREPGLRPTLRSEDTWEDHQFLSCLFGRKRDVIVLRGNLGESSKKLCDFENWQKFSENQCQIYVHKKT